MPDSSKSLEEITAENACTYCEMKIHLGYDGENCNIFFDKNHDPCPVKALIIENASMRNELQVLRFKK